MTSATKGAVLHGFGWDALSRQLAETQLHGSISRDFDLAGRMIRTSWQDGFFVDYNRLVTEELTAVRENGAASGRGVLASYYYDDLGRRVSMVRGNGSATYYAWDAVSRLAGMTHDLTGTANDLNIGSIAYNPASQIVGQTRSNDAYA